MSNEFVYVVVDLGSRWVRGGLGGSLQPMVVITNNRNARRGGFPGFMELDDYSLTREQKEELANKAEHDVIYRRLVDIYRSDTDQWMCFDGSKDAEWLLHQIFLDLFSAILTPLNRTRVMIVDGAFSILTKGMILKLLVVNFGVKSVQFLQKPVMSCIGSNSANGLVVDIGWNSCVITPVMDHRVVQELSYDEQRQLNGSALHYRLVEALIALDSQLLKKKELFLIVEQFVESCVYVRDGTEGAGDVDIGGVTVPGRLKYEIVEAVFFGPNSIVDKIRQVVQSSPMDIRRVLLNNIVFDGGVSDVPGLKKRILRELREDGDARAIKNIGAWQGASIYSSVSLNKRTRSLRKTQEVTKESLREVLIEEGLKMTQFIDPLNNVYKHQ